jgi:hypothetical protein
MANALSREAITKRAGTAGDGVGGVEGVWLIGISEFIENT